MFKVATNETSNLH